MLLCKHMNAYNRGDILYILSLTQQFQKANYTHPHLSMKKQLKDKLRHTKIFLGVYFSKNQFPLGIRKWL